MRVLAITTISHNSPTPAIQDQLEALEKNGVEVDIWKIRQSHKIDYLTMAWNVLRLSFQKKQYDLIHAFYGHCSLVARSQFRFPVVTTFQGTDMLGGINGVMHKKDGLIGRFAARLSKQVIVMSDEMKAASPHRETVVIPFGINTDIFYPRSLQETRIVLNLSSDSKYVLFPYHPNRSEKNYPIIEDAVKILCQKIPNVEIIPIFARGREEVAQYMNACDVMVMVSDHEGSPVAIREAMACNLPIVSADVGDVKQMIAGTDNCYIVDRTPQSVAESLEKVLTSGRRANGSEKMSQYDVTWSAKQVLDVYQQALS